MYAQTSYLEHVGNGPFSLAQIGCFVTAFSNLLSRFGVTCDPAGLNTFFTQHNVYLADPGDGTGVKDDLAWSSITAFDHGINVTAIHNAEVVNGAYQPIPWPPSDNSIIEFHYRHNGRWVTHFCLASMVNKQTIVDSYDSVIKQPGLYGPPVAWAVYESNAARPVTLAAPVQLAAAVQPPSRPLPQGARPLPSSGSYTLVRPIPGYYTSLNAAARRKSTGMVPTGTWTVYYRANGMVNITAHPGHPGWWINPADNMQAGHGEGWVNPREQSVVAQSHTVNQVFHVNTPRPVALTQPLSSMPRIRFNLKDRISTTVGDIDGFLQFRKQKGR